MTDPIKIKYEEPSMQGKGLIPTQETQRIETVWGSIRVVDAIPNWTPKGKQDDAIALYVNGTTSRFYIYDFTNNVWRKFTNTSIGVDGEDQLEGEVIIDGNVSQNGQTISIGGSYYATTSSGSHTFTGASQSTDVTLNPGFDPILITGGIRIDDSSIATVLPNLTHFVWYDDTYIFGPEFDAAGNLIGTDSSGLAKYTSTFSNVARLKVHAHSASSTTLRFARDAGSTDEQLHFSTYLTMFG